MNNEVDVLIKTKADNSGIKEATHANEKYHEGLEKTGEKAGDTETRIIGVHDVIDGTATVMQGPGQQGMVAYIQGWADIAGGVEGVLPLLKALSLSAIKSAATQVTSAARTVGAWLAMKATAVASAVEMAAAWVISLGPIALVIGALVAIGGLFVVLWTKSQTFRNIVEGAWGAIWTAIKKVWQVILDVIGVYAKIYEALWKVAKFIFGTAIGAWHALTNAIGGAVGAIERFINDTFFANKQQAEFFNRASSGSVQGGNRGTTAKRGFAHGGITPGGPIEIGEDGKELLDLPAGMRIGSNASNRAALAGGGGGGNVTVTIEVVGDGDAAQFVRGLIQRGTRLQGGGSVQRWLGYAT